MEILASAEQVIALIEELDALVQEVEIFHTYLLDRSSR